MEFYVISDFVYLANKDRSTGMMICETVIAGILGMAGSLLATWLVSISAALLTTYSTTSTI